MNMVESPQVKRLETGRDNKEDCQFGLWLSKEENEGKETQRVEIFCLHHRNKKCGDYLLNSVFPCPQTAFLISPLRNTKQRASEKKRTRRFVFRRRTAPIGESPTISAKKSLGRTGGLHNTITTPNVSILDTI
jgi:hypothetical protein